MSIFLFILIFARVPIAFAMGASSLLYILLTGSSITIVAQYLMSYLDSFTLLAIPLFVLSGEFMNRGEITQRLIDFANVFVGHIPGGLSHVNVVASVLEAGMSGSSTSDAATESLILVPQMERAGYPRAFAAAVTAASATIGPIIPPSIHVVLIGGINEISIGRLFMSGIVPGLLMGVSMMIYTAMIAKKRHFPKSRRATGKEILMAIKEASLPLLTPVIILGGLIGGFFTATEAAAVAALYTFFLGALVYKKIRFRGIIEAFYSTIKITSNIMLIVGFAGVVGWIMISEEVANEFTNWMLSFTSSPVVVLLFINILLLIMGCFLNTTSLIMILSPVLFPLIKQYGIDPVHFGMVMMLNLEIGQLTPPVGITSFVVMDITKTPIGPFMKEMVPFIIGLIVVLMVATYIPDLVLFIPNLIYGKG
jgi:tripartite ATP-independent transporter DctM subunit